MIVGIRAKPLIALKAGTREPRNWELESGSPPPTPLPRPLG